MKNLKKVAFLMSLVVLVGCEGGDFKESKTLAGKVVDAETLNLGQNTYVEYCIQCHGKNGDGKGVSSKGMYPPPRDFTQGVYKFGNVVIGELPHDEDFYRIIRQGLNGTAMLPWDISDKRLNAVTQYIKTFAPAVWEGEGKVLGTKFELPADPFGPSRKAEAIEKGKRVYHVSAACIQCHRGYETKDQISAYNKEINNAPLAPADFAEDLYRLKNQDSEFGWKVVPPDFTWHVLRTVNDNESLLQRLMYGVAGSGMPGWKDVVTDEDLWALTYYVQSLRELRNTPARETMLEGLK
ncbi:MAG TPA: c-type cytochrome [Bacteriovoracaceae bacterium]|nr:c-type cytochrome [Bacteriovoracaceae bacterium]